jgi:ABC-type glycerol-3-phosphate transport system permease component
MVRKIVKWAVVYSLLIAGSIIFSIPFAWMASTSTKVDRELFTKELRFLPISPAPSPQSPYVDAAYFQYVDGPHKKELLPRLERLARSSGFTPPRDIGADVAFREIAVGLYERLSRMLPQDAWKGSPGDILADPRVRIDAAVVAETFASVHRRLLWGQIRIRSRQLQDMELGAGEPFDRRLENLTPEQAQILNWTDSQLPCASVGYDLRQGDRAILSRTFDLDFEAQDFQRVQLYLCPDDTWHELWLTVERNGRRYRARRAVVLANFAWQTVTWQEPGEDDHSTRIRSWILLRPVDASEKCLDDPRKIKLTFELRKSSPARAWWNKLTLNYVRVMDQVPLWRYLATSLFLVIVNVVLTVFACSLVAYSFARLRWPGRDFCFILMLATMMIPGQVTMIPHFLIWKSLGAYNTLTPLWLGHAFGSAFFIFLLRQFLKGVPRDLEDAARVDGCGFLRIYWHIMLPLVKPALAAIAIFTFLGTWNDFMGALVYIADQRLYPLSFGLYAFSVQVGNNPMLTMAGCLLMTVPVIIIFFFAQKYFIQGVTLTGIKG